MTVNASTPFDLDKDELESMNGIIDSFETQSDTPPAAEGAIIEGRVLDVTDRDVFVDVGQKQDGRCPRTEFSEAPSPGDVVPVVILKGTDPDGLIRLSRKEADRRIAWQNLKEAHAADASLTGVVEKALTHGYILDCGGVSLFMPQSHADSKGRHRKLAVGTTLDFKILELRDKQRSAVVSHRRIIDERNDESWNDLIAKYKEGDLAEGKISKKVSFGLFVTVCGVEGLLHQSDISWKKFSSFKNLFKLGESVTARILTMDRENNRLSLGLKQLTEDPWVWAEREIHPGEVVSGKVTSVTDYGAFIELRDGLEGLVHVSELSWSKRPRHPKKYVEVGAQVQARVLGIDLEKKRISLGIKQLKTDPWDAFVKSIRVGEVREGQVTSITRFGAFVEVQDEIEGLIHFKDYSWDEKPDQKMLKKGDRVTYKILEINSNERRIGCGLKQLQPSPFEVLQKKYRKGDILEGKITKVAPFGLFVDIGDGFEGLVHISRVPLEENQKLEQLYKPGDEVRTILQGIEPDNRKIVLSIKAYEQKKDRELIEQYIKRDDGPSTSSLAAFFKNSKKDQ